jgi:hypothetical protein
VPAPHLPGKSRQRDERQGQSQMSEKVLSVHYFTSIQTTSLSGQESGAYNLSFNLETPDS